MKALKGRCCVTDKQSGYTLLEMIFALAVLGLLIAIAQPMLSIGFHQHSIMLKQREKEAFPFSMQIIENDVLQMYGNRPWRLESGVDQNNCIKQWDFETQNVVKTDGPVIPAVNIRYEVINKTLKREVIVDDRAESTQDIFNDINCIDIRFYHDKKWHIKTDKNNISALKMVVEWKGVKIERVWPVNISTEFNKTEGDDPSVYARDTEHTNNSQ